MNILLVEDDMVSKKVLEKLLSKYGTCTFANHGEEALNDVVKNIEGDYYDLICLDVMMPKLDGISVLNAIRKLETQHEVMPCKIILITALDELEVVHDAFQQGADAYITKPIHVEKFHDVLIKFGLIDV